MGRLRFKHNQRRQDLRQNQIYHWLRYLNWSGWWYWRSGSPVRYLLERNWRRSCSQLQERRRSWDCCASIDAERERISLGIKQLSDDPFNNYVAENDKGAIVKGTVKEVDAKGAVIDLGNDIEASLKGSELSRDKVEDARNELTVGAEVEAKIINVDRKNRTISLSIKAKDVSDEKDAVKAHRKTETDTASPATIGDLIKAQMDK